MQNTVRGCSMSFSRGEYKWKTFSLAQCHIYKDDIAQIRKKQSERTNSDWRNGFNFSGERSPAGINMYNEGRTGDRVTFL